LEATVASPKVSVSPSFPQRVRSHYIGNLIDSLISTVEIAEKQTSTHADNEQASSSPLTIDEVLFRSGMILEVNQ
jgi:hypothetical protein